MNDGTPETDQKPIHEMTPQEYQTYLQQLKIDIRAADAEGGVRIMQHGVDFRFSATLLALEHDKLMLQIQMMHEALVIAKNHAILSSGYTNLQEINESTPKNGVMLLDGPGGLSVGYWDEKTEAFVSRCGTYNKHMDLPTHWALVAQSADVPLEARIQQATEGVLQ